MDVVRHLLSPHFFLALFLCVEVHLVLLLVLNKSLLSVKVCLLLEHLLAHLLRLLMHVVELDLPGMRLSAPDSFIIHVEQTKNTI